MKKFSLILITLILLLATTAPALAASTPPGRTFFSAVGPIVNIESGMITVNVVTGSTLVKPYIGMDLPIHLNNQTRILVKTDDGTVVGTFSDLEVGQIVSVRGSYTNDEFTAKLITIDSCPSCLP
ncbi:MAG: hypothetical protein L0Z70_01345 [Chloroflexi bacterium]|nr:hypothetical protein [Chloroflexota bacterium]